MKTYPYTNIEVTTNYGEDLIADILKNRDEYEKQALNFLINTQSVLEVYPTGKQSMPWDGDGIERNTCTFFLKTSKGSYSSMFGLSLFDTQEGITIPTAYNILACLNPFMDCDNVADFTAEYGYDKPSEALRAFELCKAEAKALQKMYTPSELELLAEII
jgi:hypothetical protein